MLRNKLLYAFLLFAAIGISSCGNRKNAVAPIEEVSNVESGTSVDDTSNWGEVDIIAEDEFSYGTVKDFSKTDGCGFVIELNDPNSSLRILEPFELDKQFQVDGLKIKFNFTPSRRPSVCTAPSTPITINLIEAI